MSENSLINHGDIMNQRAAKGWKRFLQAKLLKVIVPVIIMICTLYANAESAVNLAEFKPKFKTGNTYNENFNSGARGWNLGRGFELRPGEGINGSTALFASSPRADKANTVFPIEVTPGSYKVSIKYRVKNIKGRNKGKKGAFILGYIQTYDATGKGLKAQNFWAMCDPAEQDWQTYSSSVTISQDATSSAKLVIVFDWWHTGEIWFDDIFIEPTGAVAAIFPLSPSNLTLNNQGSIALLAYFYNRADCNESNLAMLVSLNDKSKLLYPEHGVFRGDFGRFSKTVKVKAKLLNMKQKAIIAEHDYRLFAIPDNAKAPEGATRIDKFGRTLRNGKPILPIGTFTYQTMHPEDLKRVWDAGFDFISFGFKEAILYTYPNRQKMRSMLDELGKYSLKAMLQLQLMIPAKEHIRKIYAGDFDGLTDRDGVVTALAETVKDHPTFLGYYLADENPRNELREVQILRENINQVDPWHFTVTLTNLAENFSFFVPTGDVLCYDSYPLPDAHKFLATDRALENLFALKTPIWFCAQGFLWRINLKEHANKPDPTEGAVRTAPLLAVIHGVKGFMFYSYHEIFAKGSKFEPGHAAKFWPKVIATVKMLRELEPF
jgi:hypothetical protein